MEPLDDDVTPTPLDIPSRRKSSQQSIQFSMLCDTIAEKFLEVKTVLRKAKAEEAVRLGSEFSMWQNDPPGSERRNDRIARMQQLWREAFEVGDKTR